MGKQIPGFNVLKEKSRQISTMIFRLVENSIFGISKKSLQLHKHQLSPFAIYEENSIDGFVRGLTTQATQSFDSSFTEEVSYYVLHR